MSWSNSDTSDHGIGFHTQVVMSPEDDGADPTLSRLYHFGPAVVSVSVVPVGLTNS